MATKIAPADLHPELSRFIGSDTVTIYKLFGVRPFIVPTKLYGPLMLTFTEGVRYLCDNAGAWWLLDAIASHMPVVIKNEMAQSLHFWNLTKTERGAILTCQVDRGEPNLIKQEFEYTDFPFPSDGKFQLYAGATTMELDGELTNIMNVLLPSEY